MLSKDTFKDVVRFAACVGVLAAVQEIVVLILIFGFNLFSDSAAAMLLGTVYGSVYVILSFAHMGYCVEKCLAGDKDNAKKYMQSMYSLRLLILAAVIVVGVKLLGLNIFCMAIPLLYTRVSIMFINSVFHKKKAVAFSGEKKEEIELDEEGEKE